MVLIENYKSFNFLGAMVGMRNPMNSWGKNDTTENEMFTKIGPNDLELAQRLINAGPEHAKFLRQIFVSMDITAPIYWWKEMDTYKTGTTANSTSTMHKLLSKEITKEDFSIDDWVNPFVQLTIDYLETTRQRAVFTKDPNVWKHLIQMLPSSYNQKRTWTANYAVLRNIYFQRKNHKLSEWTDFCEFIKIMPYAKELITLGDKE